MTRPVVLISPDTETRPTRRGPTVDLLVLERPYSLRLIEAGCLPLVVPPDIDDDGASQLVALAHGLCLSGGDFDVDPALFGEARHPACGTIKPDRTQLELRLLKAAEVAGIPILGVCGGMQLMNVVHGGTLWQDLPSQYPSDVEHTQVATKDKAGHDVVVVAGTRLASMCGEGPLGVNSTHHQAIKALAPGFMASASSADGIVEAFEDPTRGFYVGVQWHPESMFADAQRAIAAGFVEACRARMPSASAQGW